jgi:hypothetical protein
MTRRSTPQLRIAPPILEPDVVLLHQLASLSASSSSAVRTARYAGARALAGAATIAVIGATTWVAGAAPGTIDMGPAQRSTPAPSGVPTPGEDVVATPQLDDEPSAPGSSWSPELPGTETSARAGAAAGPEEPEEPGQQPAVDHRGNGLDKGRGDGTGNGHGRGHAYGHIKGDRGQGHGREQAGEHGRGHARGHDRQRPDRQRPDPTDRGGRTPSGKAPHQQRGRH